MGYKTLTEELGLPTKPATPTMYIPRLASDPDCPDRIRRRARALAEAAEDAGATTGVHPAGFAAACLYTAGQEVGRWLTQGEAADIANSQQRRYGTTATCCSSSTSDSRGLYHRGGPRGRSAKQ